MCGQVCGRVVELRCVSECNYRVIDVVRVERGCWSRAMLFEEQYGFAYCMLEYVVGCVHAASDERGVCGELCGHLRAVVVELRCVSECS